jgi:hypothetical protein
MAINFVLMVFFSLIDLIKGTILNFLVPFVFVLIGIFLKRKIGKKFNLNWIFSSLISVYVLISFILLFAYFVPLFFSFSETLIGLPPAGLGVTELDFFLSLVFHFFRLLLVGVIFSFIVIPFIFLGSIVFELIEKKFKMHYLINLVLSVFVCLFVFFALWGFAFQGLERGVIYFIYFWLN